MTRKTSTRRSRPTRTLRLECMEHRVVLSTMTMIDAPDTQPVQAGPPSAALAASPDPGAGDNQLRGCQDQNVPLAPPVNRGLVSDPQSVAAPRITGDGGDNGASGAIRFIDATFTITVVSRNDAPTIEPNNGGDRAGLMGWDDEAIRSGFAVDDPWLLKLQPENRFVDEHDPLITGLTRDTMDDDDFAADTVEEIVGRPIVPVHNAAAFRASSVNSGVAICGGNGNDSLTPPVLSLDKASPKLADAALTDLLQGVL